MPVISGPEWSPTETARRLGPVSSLNIFRVWLAGKSVSCQACEKNTGTWRRLSSLMWLKGERASAHCRVPWTSRSPRTLSKTLWVCGLSRAFAAAASRARTAAMWRVEFS